VAPQITASPAALNGRIYVASLAGKIACVDLAKMSTVWEVESQGPMLEERPNPEEVERPPAEQVYASLAVTDDRVIVADRGGEVRCLSASDGKEQWHFNAKARVDSSPVIVDKRVFFGSGDGNIYAVSLADGKAVWTFATGSGVSAAPAVARGRLVIGTDDGVIYCLGKKP
jgi:outer membrane protein assembly factor BamB